MQTLWSSEGVLDHSFTVWLSGCLRQNWTSTYSVLYGEPRRVTASQLHRIARVRALTLGRGLG